jgi:hypothetical protein
MEIGNVYIIRDTSIGQPKKIKLLEKTKETYYIEFLDSPTKIKNRILISDFKLKYKVIETIGLEIPF